MRRDGSVEVVDGFRLTVYTATSRYRTVKVWLDDHCDNYEDGICLGAGDTRQVAIADALAVLRAAVARLEEQR